jgi:hypothetical protein
VLPLALLMSTGPVVAQAPAAAPQQALPVPPCAGQAVPAPSDLGALLNQSVWIEDQLPADWMPPACTGWTPGPTRVLLAGAGRFESAGGTEELASKLTRFSALTDLVYWSSTRDRWRPLFKEAVALSEPDRRALRSDFSADDFVPGAELYYWLEEDNPVTGVVYQMHVHERTEDRLVFETFNVSSLRARFLFIRPEVAPSGEFRQLYFIEREDGDSWRYYCLVRLGESGGLAGTSAANYMNRAEGFFRMLAGLDMQREPPAAP